MKLNNNKEKYCDIKEEIEKEKHMNYNDKIKKNDMKNNNNKDWIDKTKIYK